MFYDHDKKVHFGHTWDEMKNEFLSVFYNNHII